MSTNEPSRDPAANGGPGGRRYPDVAAPDGTHIAVWIGLNIEHYPFGKPALSLFPEVREVGPDTLNSTWRNYGIRAGVGRLFDLFEQLQLRGTVLLNSEICTHEPGIVRRLQANRWAIVAHGVSNERLHPTMSRAEEEQEIRQATADINAAFGSRPLGWLSPYRSPGDNTFDLIAREGYSYSLDPADDDSIYAIPSVARGELLCIPYSLETNDIVTCLLRGMSAREFADQLRDQFVRLYSETAGPLRVLGLSLHTFIIGQSFRIRYLEEVLRELLTYPNVWWTTSDDLAAAVANPVTVSARRDA